MRWSGVTVVHFLDRLDLRHTPILLLKQPSIQFGWYGQRNDDLYKVDTKKRLPKCIGIAALGKQGHAQHARQQCQIFAWKCQFSVIPQTSCCWQALHVSLIGWISATLSQGCTDVQSLTKCLDHRHIVSDTACSRAKVCMFLPLIQHPENRQRRERDAILHGMHLSTYLMFEIRSRRLGCQVAPLRTRITITLSSMSTAVSEPDKFTTNCQMRCS